MLKTITPEQVLLLMRKTTSQAPMTDGEIASLLDTKRDKVNEVLDQLYEGKAISSCKSIKGGIECRQVWVTGLPYRPVYVSRPTPTQPTRTPVQPIKQETTMDDAKAALIVPTNLNEKGIKTPQKILRFLFANTKATSNEIRKACELQYVDPFIKVHVRKGYIDRTIDTQTKLAVYAITPKGRLLGSADALHNHAKVKTPSMIGKATDSNETVFVHIAAQQEAVTENQRRFKTEAIKPVLQDQQYPEKAIEKWIAEDKADIEFKLDTKPADPVRFALTDDGTLMIIGIHYQPIELSKADTKRLYDFAENTVHAI